MRRILSLAFVAAACIAAVLLTGASEEEGARTYRVDALFYNAAHLIPGQTVKIAGAEVGSVKNVKLTSDRRARVQMEIDDRFAPFRTDARCTIRPQSLIGEKFVQCVPGTPKAPELKAENGEVATVPVKQNRTPVDLDLVFDALRMPYRERLELIINELGAGLAGRPEELNQAIRQANPALDETNRVLEILDSDRARLGKLIDASDTVIAELAGKKGGEVQDFIDRAGSVADEVASKKGDVDLAIHRLPPLLAELEPAANDLSTLAREARPILGDLREAAPGVRALAADLDPLNDAARPALVRLADMSRTGRSAVRAANPIADLLRPVADRLPGVTGPTLALLNDMRKRGVVEGLQNFTYYATLATARFDRYSHILPSYQLTGLCAQFATEPVEGCDSHFAGAKAGTKSKTTEKKTKKQKKKKRRKRRRGRDSGDETGQGQAAPPETSAPAAPVPSVPGVPSVPTPSLPTPPAVPPTPDAVDDLLDFLLGS